MLVPVRSPVQQTSEYTVPRTLHLCAKSMSLVMLLTEYSKAMRHRLEEGMSFTSRHVCTMTYMNAATCVHYHMGIDTWIVCRTHVCRERRHERRSGARALHKRFSQAYM